MNKKVFLNQKQQIELGFDKKLNEEELKSMLNVATTLIKKIREKDLPVYLLANVNDLNNLTIGARSYGSAWLLKQPINKIAIYGNNLFMKHFIRMLSEGLGLNDKIKFFTTKKEAEKWL
ncbi:MAG: STAS/SEC14 domain-containing protein [Flavobacteriales bacterium]|nr:STAS/SEC14 domain-containing protein [Flavobacteriales bacterium]